ncbi:Flp pilus assembly protein CpaB [Vibrio genomosp. F10]|uniref:Flp pilus assembly protein CpaB n=1 Tax=Vibrio genomosp. F10 TaxID=723171 RepID=A0A1B9QY99_9VIBR|nr:Flp pilus assembly protein CpaB [Vibrio genomosp. F10]OCH75563.1 Flp pilus assembly protein CpaB [Vibrio genomosp. F10]OEE84991.1 Flp pilus assembly protein CpaB [Vibrio genomosp. F10 str. 9ZD137]
MSKQQVILLFLLSIVFGLGAVFFAKQWMDRQVQPQVKTEVVEREPVVIAAQSIPAGTVIESLHLTSKLLEVSWRDSEQFVDQEAVIGLVANADIFQGELINPLRVTSGAVGSTLASLISENMRAVTIRVDDVIGVAGFLLPGNRVDILSTINHSKTYTNTSTVLKDIKVLAVDQTARTQENAPVVVRAVTLEVTPKDAEKLLTAKSKGIIQLTLRNPHEPEEVVVKRRVAPSVTIIKGTQSSNIRVKD